MKVNTLLPEERSKRKPTYEDWVIFPETRDHTLSCRMLNVSETGALFAVEGRLMIDETVYVCPHPDDNQRKTISSFEVKSHPESVYGRVVRIDELGYYGIEFDFNKQREIDEEVSNVLNDDTFTCNESVRDGYIELTANGSPSMKEFSSFCGAIQSHINDANCICINLSGVKKLASMSKVFFKKVLQDMDNHDCKVAVIDMQTVGSSFSDTLNEKSNIKTVRNKKQAEAFFQS